MLRRLVVLAVLASGSGAVHASKGVASKLTGCVVDGAFYSIDGRAYRIATPADLDLKPFEGKGIAIGGMLYPGDRFEPDGAPIAIKHKTCPSASLRLIKRDVVVGLRVEATKAATAGEHDRAVALIAEAMAVLAPPDCDTFTDRATVMALHGDLAAVKLDIAVLKAKKKCVMTGRMNPLLLQDLGAAVLAKGDKPLAIAAYQLALAACDGAWCRPDIQRALAAAKQ